MRPHVLIVDDTEFMRELATMMLERGGYRVTAVGSAAEALDAIADAPPDLVLSDVMMPEMDGYELLERLRADARSATLPVIFLTALGDTAAMERGRRLGVDSYVVKPFTAKQLIASISGTLGR